MAVGEFVYAGSAGIALFLIELYRQTGDEECRRTAIGALRRSIHYLRRFPRAYVTPLSFFSAHLGAAYVVTRLPAEDRPTEFTDDLRWLLGEVARAIETPHTLDVMGGNAGAIPILLHLGKSPEMEHCLELARRCGEQLRQAAMQEDGRCAWNAKEASGEGFNSPPMTGFSHGTSGMALALLEVYAQTGDREYRDTARRAFVYEDTLFSARVGNWLDVRFPYTIAEDGNLSGTFQTAWCHGGPGIALARMRASQLDPEQARPHEEMARAALATTLLAIEQKLSSPRFDTSLCHGIAGLSEISLIGSEMLGEERYRVAAMTTAQELIRRYDTAGDWPSGAPEGGQNPTLMIGTAGIGLHFLRLSRAASVPPILSVAP
jgi:lantibiotic modifying enzyme